MTNRAIIRRVNEIEGVAAGQTAVIKLPIGRTYHGLTIPYSSLSLAEMEEIRVVANGDVLQRYKGADVLDQMNVFDGLDAASGVLRLDFERHNLLTRQAREYTVIGTGLPAGDGEGHDPRKITNLRVEIDIADGATSPSISDVRAKMSRPRESGRILRVQQQTYEFGGSGEFEISDLKLVGGLVNRVWFHTANIDRVRLDIDDREVFDRRRVENDIAHKDGVRVPDAAAFVVDTTEEGYGQDWISVQGAQDVRFRLYLSAAATFPVVVETIDRLRM